MLFKPFTQRYKHLIYDKKITVSLSTRTRKRLFKTLEKYNYYFECETETGYQYRQTTFEKTYPDLLGLYGVYQLHGENSVHPHEQKEDLESFFMSTYPSKLLDVVEIFYSYTPTDLSRSLQIELNNILQHEGVSWIFCDGYFFKLDSQWVQEEILDPSYSFLKTAQLTGVLTEFNESRKDLVSGDTKGAISNASNAIESLLKSILGVRDRTLENLLKLLMQSDFYKDLPNEARQAVGVVLKNVSLLRHKLGGHGQGKEHFDCPENIAKYAVHMMGATVLFLMNWRLECSPVEDDLKVEVAETNSVPFEF